LFILASNEIVFINFYANWCRFSQILNPIYDQLADKISKPGLIFIGKIDCDADGKNYSLNSFE
jgi:endoplasmic reticulum resident protein 44